MSGTLGERIAELREKAKKTQPELAQMLGTNTTTISRWENNRGKPHLDQLESLSKFFGVTLDYLVFGTSHESPVDTRAFHEFLATEYGRTAQRNGWLDAIKSIRYPSPPTVDLYIDMVIAFERMQRAKGGGS